MDASVAEVDHALARLVLFYGLLAQFFFLPFFLLLRYLFMEKSEAQVYTYVFDE